MGRAKAPRPKPKYRVIRDTREQEQGDGWWWDESEICSGTDVRTLATGDYTLEGFEDDFVIERKSGTAELAKNIIQDRFERELQRMEQFKFPILIAECSWEDVYRFPEGSGIPRDKWKDLKISNYFLARQLVVYQVKYRTKIVLAGATHAKLIASSFFKRVIESRDGIRF